MIALLEQHEITLWTALDARLDPHYRRTLQLLPSTKSWEKRHNLLLATLARLFALLAIGGMVVVCIATGAWLVNLWKVLPLLNDVFPGMSVQLPLGFVMMVVAIVTALVALVRSTVTLRAVSAATDNTSALPQRDRTGPKDWIVVLPALLFVFIELMTQRIGGFFPPALLFVARMLLIPPLFVLGSMMFACAVKKHRVKVADLPNRNRYNRFNRFTSKAE